MLSIALRHPAIEHGLNELRRNESLRRLAGIESEESVPKKRSLSRLLDRLGQQRHLSHLHGVFDTMSQRLGAALPELGRDTAGDRATLLRSLTSRFSGGAAPSAATGC
ncbi:MAG: hypothetical protein K6T86_09925 [Pirellulales bacterium]|nr:hypothetical protein [Pirellulales bacterium]